MLASEIKSDILEVITLEFMLMALAEDRLIYDRYYLSEMDEFFGDKTPKIPAQAASVRFVCYNTKDKSANKPVCVLLAIVQKLLQDALPRTHLLGRLIIDIRKDKSTSWF